MWFLCQSMLNVLKSSRPSNRHGKVIKHFPGFRPRCGGGLERACKVENHLHSVFHLLFCQTEMGSLSFSGPFALCMAGEHVPVCDIKTDCDVNSKTWSFDSVSILNLKRGTNKGGQSVHALDMPSCVLAVLIGGCQAGRGLHFKKC